MKVEAKTHLYNFVLVYLTSSHIVYSLSWTTRHQRKEQQSSVILGVKTAPESGGEAGIIESVLPSAATITVSVPSDLNLPP